MDEAGRWANSSLEGADNAEIVYDDDETLTEPVMRIVAIKPINAGEEILVNYGEPFREGIREKLLRKSQEEPAKRVKNTDKCISCGMMALFREETSRTRVFCNETCQKKFY